MVTIIVRYESKPGVADAIASALGKLIAPTRREPGCLQFVVYRCQEEPGQFVIYEQYADEDALAAHRETAHYLEMHRVVPPMLAGRQKGRYDEVALEGELDSSAAGTHQPAPDRGEAGR
jgi:quinol monooxygenase YgiN